MDRTAFKNVIYYTQTAARDKTQHPVANNLPKHADKNLLMHVAVRFGQRISSGM